LGAGHEIKISSLTSKIKFCSKKGGSYMRMIKPYGRTKTIKENKSLKRILILTPKENGNQLDFSIINFLKKNPQAVIAQ
jgi:hypothetical protein